MTKIHLLKLDRMGTLCGKPWHSGLSWMFDYTFLCAFTENPSEFCKNCTKTKEFNVMLLNQHYKGVT